jgi:hypothetical protein
VRVALLVAGVVLVGACGSGGPGDDPRELAVAQLDDVLERAHERALQERAADPTAGGAMAAERLGRAVTGGNAANVVSTTATDEGLEVITTIGVRTQVGGGLSYVQVSLGACLRTRATPGAPSGEGGLRGTVSTEAVACPDGVLPLAEGVPVDATSTQLDRLRTPVPADIGRPCPSGARYCSGG